MLDNKDICCFFVTKHSWKGKYKRIFSVGTRGITTYNPTTLENTNQVKIDQIRAYQKPTLTIGFLFVFF